MKYMVMECHPGYAVVLSDDGRFLKAANMRYEVGQTVDDVTLLQLPEQQSPKRNSRRWLSLVAAAAACLVLTVTGLFHSSAPYASVYMTINPEVRIDVNRADSVVGVEGINADGTDLLEGYDYQHKDLELVMDELVDRAIDMGYLHEGGTITLNLDADETWVSDHETTINAHLSDHLQEKLTVNIDIAPRTPAKTEQETHSGETIVIPVGDSGYGDSAYGEDTEEDWDDGDSAYDTDSDEEEDGDSAYDAEPDEEEGDGSGYDSGSDDEKDEDDDGDSAYAANPRPQKSGEDTPYADDGQTDYGDKEEPDEDED